MITKIIDPKTYNPRLVASIKNIRRGSSAIAVSLENLLITLPEGFLSKKVD